jgi:hypothetical protein
MEGTVLPTSQYPIFSKISQIKSKKPNFDRCMVTPYLAQWKALHRIIRAMHTRSEKPHCIKPSGRHCANSYGSLTDHIVQSPMEGIAPQRDPLNHVRIVNHIVQSPMEGIAPNVISPGRVRLDITSYEARWRALHSLSYNTQVSPGFLKLNRKKSNFDRATSIALHKAQ